MHSTHAGRKHTPPCADNESYFLWCKKEEEGGLGRHTSPTRQAIKLKTRRKKKEGEKKGAFEGWVGGFNSGGY